MLPKSQKVLSVLLLFLLHGCGDSWNDPYPKQDSNANTLYTAFTERPKHLDPALSYTTSEAIFTYQVYEPPLQYHYLKRPYELIPLVAEQMPTITYIDKNGKEVTQPGKDVAFTLYTIPIKKNVNYQKHPAFAKDEKNNEYLYHHLTDAQVADKHTLDDFPHQATRELIAEDFVYEIKRLADPTLNSPIAGLMENYIEGFKDFSNRLRQEYQKIQGEPGDLKYLDLRTVDFEGAKVIDRYTYQVKIKGLYPQFLYWLAMPFFAPIPWEAAKFYTQTPLLKRNISLDWYPVGTGPFILTENNPNLQMTLTKNPDFHGEYYPSEGDPKDKERGLLINAGKPMPFLDKVVFVLEKENIPYWSKFLQGYYDQSAVTSNNFDQSIKSSSSNNLELSDQLKAQGVKLSTSVTPAIMYWGFNMLDDIVGGYTEKKRKLRQAIAIAMDMEEYINIFLNGSAIVAQSPIPPGIFGYQPNLDGVDTHIFDVDPKKGNFKRKSIQDAKRLLSEAGYPGGIDPKTKQALILYLDEAINSGPDAQAQMAWVRKQFKKIGIELIVRATQYNRFQDKMSNGDFQIYSWGWNADYPDPENFMFLLYSQNSKVKHEGENTSNYVNNEFDKLFEEMKVMPNNEQRLKLIGQMISILQEDVPWFAGFYPKLYGLRHQWVGLSKPNAMTRYTLKYSQVDPKIREKYQKLWNRPDVKPLVIGFLIFILLCIPATISYWRKTHLPLKLKVPEKLKERN